MAFKARPACSSSTFQAAIPVSWGCPYSKPDGCCSRPSLRPTLRLCQPLESFDPKLPTKIQSGQQNMLIKRMRAVAIRTQAIQGRQAQCSGEVGVAGTTRHGRRSEEHTSELQSLMRIEYAVFCSKK